MIQAKYLIIVGVIVCLFVLYYFYDEISGVKKMFLPTYHKTMSLEAKVFELEKKSNELLKKKIVNPMIDSPALSVTYQSDMCKNGNLSIKYADLTDTEAHELLHNINQNSKNRSMTQSNKSMIQPNNQLTQPNRSMGQPIRSMSQPIQSMSQPIRQLTQINRPSNMPDFGGVPVFVQPTGGNQNKNDLNERSASNDNTIKFQRKTADISDFRSETAVVNSSISNNKNIIYTNNDIFDEETDVINVKISDIIKKPTINNGNNNNNNIRHNVSDQIEYDEILNNLDKKNHSADFFDDDTELDPSIIKSISESIHYADMSSETILSDMPIVSRSKKSSKKSNSKTNRSK